MAKTVYLAGGISGLSYQQATEWREIATAVLEAGGYRVLDPMRGKLDLIDEKEIHHDYQEEHLTPEAIFNQDLKDIEASDIIFARMDTAKSIGTPWEVGYAFAREKEIVLAVDQSIRKHPFVVGTTEYIYTDWLEALRQVAEKFYDFPFPVSLPPLPEGEKS